MKCPCRPFVFVVMAMFWGALSGVPASALSIGGLEISERRGEGSEAESQVFNGLRREFNQGGLVLHTIDFTKLDDTHSFSQALWFRIPGRLPGELVVLVPTSGVAGASNLAGLETAVAWARASLRNAPQVSLTFLFSGAQRGPEPFAGLGSKTFLKDFFPQAPAAVLVLDLDQSDRPVNLIAGSGRFPSPIWLTRSILEAFETNGFAPEVEGIQPQIFRFDLPERRNLLQPWFERDIPALMLVTAHDRVLAPGTTKPLLVSGLQRFLGLLPDGIPDTWDKHYLYFQLGDFKGFLSQQVYIVVLLSTLSVVLFVFLFFSGSLQRDLGTLLRGLWQLPVLFSFLFLFLFAGTLLTNELFRLRDFQDYWKYAPLSVLLLKVSVGIGLYSAVFLQFRRLPLSRWPGFYSYAAFFLLAIGVLASAAIELSFSFYFLWAFLFAAIFHVLPWRPAKFVAFVISPVWFVKTLLEVFWLVPDPELIRITLVSPFAGNFALSAILFPFLLLVNSYHYTRHQRQERNEKHRSRISLALWFSLALALSLVLLRSDPFEGGRTPLTRVETLDLVERTRVETTQTPIASDLPAQRTLPFLNGVWATKVTRVAFLDRLVWTVHFAAFRQAESVSLTLEGDDSLIVYDANFPYSIDATGNRVTILVGRTPPTEFDLVVTLGNTVTTRLLIDAQFGSPPAVEQRRGRSYLTTRKILVHDVQVLSPSGQK